MKFRTKQIFKHMAFLLLLPAVVTAQQHPEENYLKGFSFYQLEEYDSALVYLRKAAGINENNADAYYYSGLAWFKLDHPDSIIRYMLKVEDLDKGRGAIWIARAYARKNDPEQCLRYLELNLKSNYRVAESEIMLDPDFSRFEKEDLWLEFWRNSNYYTGFDEMMAEANYLIKTNEYIEAINLLSDGMKGGYRKSPLYAKRAEVYLAMENQRLALSDLNMAIEGDRRNAALFELRGDVNSALGKDRDALADYEKALRYDPDKLSLYPKKALALSKSGNYEAAVKDMDFYLSFFKDDHEAWYQYGQIHADAGKLFNALECYNKCLVPGHSDPRYFFARGMVYMKTGTYKYARNDFSMALDLDPENAEAYYQKGLAAVQLGRLSEACFCFEQALKLGKFEAREEMTKTCN